MSCGLAVKRQRSSNYENGVDMSANIKRPRMQQQPAPTNPHLQITQEQQSNEEEEVVRNCLSRLHDNGLCSVEDNVPRFSLKQVKMICERMLNDQEQRLRSEYENALIKKLEEQQNLYTQYAKEQHELRPLSELTCRNRGSPSLPHVGIIRI